MPSLGLKSSSNMAPVPASVLSSSLRQTFPNVRSTRHSSTPPSSTSWSMPAMRCPTAVTIRITTVAVAHGAHDAPFGQYVRLRVRDNGAGMPPRVLSKIFDPYFTTKGESGTGLGIPQVQAWMRQLGGYVTVQSTVGKGTTFDLFFPVHETSAAIALEASEELDRWADEGGAIGLLVAPRARRTGRRSANARR